MNDETIFVQIASYRDPELVPTVLDLFETAAEPDNLKVYICWQHDDFENLNILKSYGNVEIIDIPFYESKGACWARNQIQRRYDGEKYTLQLDSHHRFVSGWDTELKTMYSQCKSFGSEKPLITAYLPAFDPFNPKEEYEMVPWKMDFSKFLEEGAAFLVPHGIDNYKELSAPISSRFYSAHFAFTDGKFCEEVSHDPEYYFFGEEISIAVRAFTNGYDLYHPHKVLAWHEYTRSARLRHWDDHNVSKQNIKGIKNSWWERDLLSQKRNRVLFGMETDNSITIKDKYNFGKVRSLEDYERYAGIKFKTREVSIYTFTGKLPPTPLNENFISGKEPKLSDIKKINKTINLDSDVLFSYNDVSSILIKVYDSKNRMLLMQKCDDEMLKILKSAKSQIPLRIQFETVNENDNFYCKVFTYNKLGRELNSSKNIL